MADASFWPKLVLAVLATWRLTHLVAREDGPGHCLARLRARLGSSLVGRLMDCFHCLSVWVAAPLAFVVLQDPAGWFLAWAGISGAACLLERLGQQPVLIHPLAETTSENQNYGMLWPSQNHAEERPGARPESEPSSGDGGASGPPT